MRDSCCLDVIGSRVILSRFFAAPGSCKLNQLQLRPLVETEVDASSSPSRLRSLGSPGQEECAISRLTAPWTMASPTRTASASVHFDAYHGLRRELSLFRSCRAQSCCIFAAPSKPLCFFRPLPVDCDRDPVDDLKFPFLFSDSLGDIRGFILARWRMSARPRRFCPGPPWLVRERLRQNHS